MPMPQAATYVAAPYQVAPHQVAVHEKAQDAPPRTASMAPAPSPHVSHGASVHEVPLGSRPRLGQEGGQQVDRKAVQESTCTQSLHPFTSPQVSGLPQAAVPAAPGGVGQSAAAPQKSSQQIPGAQNQSEWREFRWTTRNATVKSGDSGGRRNGLTWKNAEIL